VSTPLQENVREIIIGIDLGTTNSEVAVVRAGQLEVIPVDHSRLLPSVVGLAEDGSLLVGQPANNQYLLYPERTIKSIKRRMGKPETVTLGERSFSPPEISAMILGRLKQAAEAHLGQTIGKAVITVPAYFSDAQRQATRDAGTLAGLEVVRIINEPTAAALAYEGHLDARKHVLVYDLGGGTFDVSVVRVEQEIVEVLASHGNNHLGGDDFDARILEHCIQWLKREKGVDPTQDRRAMARLTRAAEVAKIQLSDAPFAQINEEYLMEQAGQPVHLSLELSRNTLEEMLEPYVNETLEAIHTALDGARLTVADLDEVLLVGGSTRIPLIQRRLEESLGLPPRNELDPELCVATGAALQAGMISGERVANILLDITPYTFGTSAIHPMDEEQYPFHFVPLIRKNTPIPVTKTEAFSTCQDGQRAITVNVYQGEDPDALNNTLIGSYRVEGLGNVPAGNLILITFSLDIDGILRVTSVEKETGLEKRILIEKAMTHFAPDELEAAHTRVQDLLSGQHAASNSPTGGHSGRLSVQAQALIEKAERLLTSVSAEDAEDLVNALEELHDAMANQDAPTLEQAINRLTDLIFFLEV
jgi:molecular chaperone DnaK